MEENQETQSPPELAIEQCRNCKRVRFNGDPKAAIQPPCDWCLSSLPFQPISIVNPPKPVADPNQEALDLGPGNNGESRE